MVCLLVRLALKLISFEVTARREALSILYGELEYMLATGDSQGTFSHLPCLFPILHVSFLLFEFVYFDKLKSNVKSFHSRVVIRRK